MDCICGNIKEDKFTFAFAMADGEVWKCLMCEEDIIVEFEEED